jgi:energy-coupling factor transporter transmembrane protein EcfT
MHWTTILFLISASINVILAYLLHNSHVYRTDEAVKFPLILWLIFAVITLIPVINCIACILYIIILCVTYGDDIELNDDFWLAKRY